MKRLLTVSQVADFLGVSEEIIYALVRKGELPSVTTGSTIRIKESDLEAYLDRPTHVGEDKPDNDVVIVTRHKGAVEWLKRRGVTGPTFDRVRRSDIRDKIVYGVVPLPMSRFAKMVYIIDMPYADQDYDEMSADDMERAGAHLVPLIVTVANDRDSLR